MLGQFVIDRWSQIWFASWQHFSRVGQCLVLAVVIVGGLAVLVYRSQILSLIANGISAVGLTIPSIAVIETPQAEVH